MLKIFKKENSSTYVLGWNLNCVLNEFIHGSVSTWNNADISLVKVYYKFNRNRPLFNDILNTF